MTSSTCGWSAALFVALVCSGCSAATGEDTVTTGASAAASLVASTLQAQINSAAALPGAGSLDDVATSLMDDPTSVPSGVSAQLTTRGIQVIAAGGTAATGACVKLSGPQATVTDGAC